MFDNFAKFLSEFMKLFSEGVIKGNTINSLGGGVYVD